MLSVQSCLIACDPQDCSPPGSSVHGILQTRIQEWVAMPCSRGSSSPRDQTQLSSIAGRVFKAFLSYAQWSIPLNHLVRLGFFFWLAWESQGGWATCLITFSGKQTLTRFYFLIPEVIWRYLLLSCLHDPPPGSASIRGNACDSRLLLMLLLSSLKPTGGEAASHPCLIFPLWDGLPPAPWILGKLSLFLTHNPFTGMWLLDGWGFKNNVYSL